jgi:hypothetical protein
LQNHREIKVLPEKSVVCGPAIHRFSTLLSTDAVDNSARKVGYKFDSGGARKCEPRARPTDASVIGFEGACGLLKSALPTAAISSESRLRGPPLRRKL